MRRWGRWGAEPTSGETLQLIGAGLAIVALGIAGTLWEAPLPRGIGPKPVPETESTGARLTSALSMEAVERALIRQQGEGLAVVRRLCRDEYAGRKAGTPGADSAAAWLAAEFQRIGLQPAPGAPRFLHRFTMPVSLLASRWDRKAKLTARAPAVGPTEPRAGRRLDLTRTALIEYPCFRGEGFSAEAEAVFAGWGISRRDQGWDDYQGPDVRGKYVVYYEGAPGPGLDREEHARWRDAKARGALGCLVLSRRADTEPAGLESPIRDFPVLRLDPGSASRLLNAPVPLPGAPSGRALAPLRIDIPRAEDPARPVANVIGMIPGSDPDVAGEVVILSAHYDHLGSAGDARRQATGDSMQQAAKRQGVVTGSTGAGLRPASIFPGADDDASGVAVVLGVAHALRAGGFRPRRTVLFCLWTGEECGLVGSRAYVEKPLAPLEKTRFVLQVEMVGAGRTDTFETSSAHLAGTGHAALQAAADRLGFSLAGDRCKGVSDHLPFTRRGVPALVVTTTGEHPDYHTSRDTVDRLHPEGIDNATRLCALTLWQEANQ